MRNIHAVRRWQERAQGLQQPAGGPPMGGAVPARRQSMINWGDKSQQIMKQAPSAPPPGGMAQGAIDWKSKIAPGGVAGQIGAGMGAGMANMMGAPSKAPPPIMPTGRPQAAVNAPPPSQGLPPPRQPMAPAAPMQNQQQVGPAAPAPMQPQGVGPAMQPAQNMQQQGGPLVDAMTQQNSNPQMTAQVMPRQSFQNNAQQMMRAY